MISNIKALVEACKRNNIPYSFMDNNNNVVLVKDVFFANSATPLNSEDVSAICRDKHFTYQILKDSIQMPKTKAYFDPAHENYSEYKQFTTMDQIVNDIENDFAYPVMIKRNRGERGINVIKCDSRNEVMSALTKVYDKNTRYYDYVALAQEYLNPQAEYRVITLNKKIELMYTWEGVLSVILPTTDPMHDVMQKFINPLFSKLNLNWSGIDVVMNDKNELFLLELNSKPAFNNFAEHNGLQPLIEVYEKVLSHLFKN